MQARTRPAPDGIGYLGALGDSHDAALRDRYSDQFLVPGLAGAGKRGRNRETRRKKEKEKAVADSPEEKVALAPTTAGAVRCRTTPPSAGTGWDSPPTPTS